MQSSVETGIICPECSQGNASEQRVCMECGTMLTPLPAAGGTSLKRIQPLQGPLVVVVTLILDETRSVRAVIKPGERKMLGRLCPFTHKRPDIELDSLEALDYGVSRTHAQLDYTQSWLQLIDMDSANGTFVNGQRLLVDRPHLLRNRDRIRLGRLPLELRLESLKV
jgi:hypothetical protein